MKRVLISIIGIVLIVVLLIGFAGFIPGLSSLLGAKKPVDLGVSYDASTFTSAEQKLGVNVVTQGTSTGAAKEIDTTLTNEELSALMNAEESIKDAQARINSDGTIEISGASKKQNNPFYAKVRLTVTGPQHVAVDIISVKSGKVDAPVTQKMEDLIELNVNNYLAKTPGLRLDDISVTDDGQLHIKGAMPSTLKI